MANIFRESSGPYALVFLIGAAGWLVDSTVKEIADLKLIEYEIAYFYEASPPRAEITIYNRSRDYSLTQGTFSFRCVNSENSGCFGEPRRSGIPAEYRSLGGISLRSQLSWNVFDRIIDAEARLPSQSSAQYVLNISSTDTKIVTTLGGMSEGALDSRIVLSFREGRSWEGWLIRNYLSALIWVLLSLSIALFLWLTVSFISFLLPLIGKRCRRRPQDENETSQETIHVILSQE